MQNDERKPDDGKPNIARSVDPLAPRTRDYSLGIDDIGLPEDIVPEGARKPEEIRPQPGKIRDKAANKP